MTANAAISVEQLTAQPLPIFSYSAMAFRQTLPNESAAFKYYGEIILKDPGLAVYTLGQLQPKSGKSRDIQISSMSQAAMLLGIERVKQLPRGRPVLERSLNGQAKEGFQRAACRAFHAAFQAWDWAHIKQDHAPDEITLAALLHDVAELALWVAAPERMHLLRKLIFKDRLHTDEAQYLALGESMEHFSRQIATSWNLPPLVHDALRPEHANKPRVRGVMLAVQLARAAERGWHTPKMQQTLELIAEYLNASLDDTISHIHNNAVRAAREADFFNARPAAALLPMLPGGEHLLIEEEFPEDQAEIAAWERSATLKAPAAVQAGKTSATSNTSSRAHAARAELLDAMSSATTICLTPQREVYLKAARQLKDGVGKLEINAIMRSVIHGLHDGAGLNRVVFAMLSSNRSQLQSRFIIGADNDPRFSRFNINLEAPNLFTRAMEKPVSLWVNDENRDKYWNLIPPEFKALVNNNSFYLMSVHIKDKPIGLYYADRRSPDCALDANSYTQFRQLCQLANQALAAASGNLY